MLGSLTIHTKGGPSYAANNLQILRKGWDDYGKCVLVFDCSGVLTQLPVEDVESIDLNVRPMPSPPLPAESRI